MQFTRVLASALLLPITAAAAQVGTLEVRYRDASRKAFEILAPNYHLVGALAGPALLSDAASGEPWLWLEVVDAAGRVYSSRAAVGPTRLNVYRRGPYFCEPHWLDLQVVDASGRRAPLRGDLALYCQRERILATITWHGSADFPAAVLRVRGKVRHDQPLKPIAKGARRDFSFALFGSREPLAPAALETLAATAPLRYDPRRGCYRIGSTNRGGFQEHFYHHPNAYEGVRLRIHNDAQPRTLLICHETVAGHLGCLECGVLRDERGHPLPALVQTSKNFAGEREEPLYNPADTPFGETWFPITLAPHETRTLTSLHLYQNWGRHPLAQISSLGAWMDYLHCSSGVTETTCYVPFKFGGLGGVAIADLRAMDQPSFWGGQPQHDNIAGHVFLSYRSAAGWQYLVYRGAKFLSTGPNWMHAALEYRSSDDKIEGQLEIAEFPQRDRVRSFFKLDYRVKAPLHIADASRELRLLEVRSGVQRLHQVRLAASGLRDTALDFSRDHFAVAGHRLPQRDAFAVIHGDRKGGNAFVLRSWRARAGGEELRPALSAHCRRDGATRLLLVPEAHALELRAGDSFHIEGFWLPLGSEDPAAAARAEADPRGGGAMRIIACRRGTPSGGLLPSVRAEGDRAEFTIQGGRGLLAIRVTGLSTWRRPRIERREKRGWRAVAQHYNDALDGVQVAAEPDRAGCYSATFIVAADREPQRLRVSAGPSAEPAGRLELLPGRAAPGAERLAAQVRAGWMKTPLRLILPAHSGTTWRRGPRGDLWFEVARDGLVRGGRLRPLEEQVEIELWCGNQGDRPVACESTVELENPPAAGAGHALALVQPGPARSTCPPGRRLHQRGALYLMEASGEDLRGQMRRDFPPPPEPPERPNFILLMADDLGWGDTGFNGHPVLRTPNLDAMAAAGLRFERFYAAAPVCSPTRGSCLTGRHPYRYGIRYANVGHMPPRELTLAELLRTLGYRTGHFGKWHLGTLTRKIVDSNRGGPRGVEHYSPPWQNGFDTCFSTEAKVPTWNPMLAPGTNKPYGTAYWIGPEQRARENLAGDDSRVIMDRVIPFVRAAARRGQPFFATVWFHTPHKPVLAGPRYLALYPDQPPAKRHYYGCITAMDEQIGRLRAELRTLGLERETMVWFCSDNGPEGRSGRAPGSAGPLRGRKRSLLEGGVRVPGLLEWPGRVRPGRSTTMPAVTSDYLPTILDLLSLEPADGRPLDGISLTPLLGAEMHARTRPIAFESRDQVALIRGRYKLYRRAKAPFQLFDLEADPGESSDLADQLPREVAAMRAILEQWRESCRASAAR